ncbi:MAG: hypothetical protein KTR30_38745 [Saprospiraceae bacterium]|nr:hypothetical protein [Saprospiraceae bacterium]
MKKSWNTDRILGLSAMMISLLTLIIFVYQTNIMRKQSRLSVTPRLSFNQQENINDSLYTYKNNMVNKGLGPAIIESVTIIYKGERIDLRFSDFFEEHFPQYKKFAAMESDTRLSKGSTLTAGESVNFFTIVAPVKTVEAFRDYLEVDNDNLPFDIEVIYRSIYEERWQMFLHSEEPIPL